jgi:hypothetical protein
LKKHGQLYEDKGTPYENLGTLCSNLGMLSMFAGTPYEGEKGIREESRGHRAVLRMLAGSWRQPRGREERLSQRKATLRAHLGTPSMRLEMPDEERTMRALRCSPPRQGAGRRSTNRPDGDILWTDQREKLEAKREGGTMTTTLITGAEITTQSKCCVRVS